MTRRDSIVPYIILAAALIGSLFIDKYADAEQPAEVFQHQACVDCPVMRVTYYVPPKP
jgi:cytochrome c551/c552